MKVLIVEDEVVSRRMLESLLPLWGYEVVTAADGVQAWDLLRLPDAPRLALVDWMMPGLDGIELTRRIRAEVLGHYIHVVLITARDTRADLVEGLEAGADDYLVKPFDPNELRVRLAAAKRALAAQDELEKLAEQLAVKNRRLAELTETAHRFVDNVAHEFRTPLTVIKEFAAIMSDGIGGPVTDAQTDYLRTIKHAVQDLVCLVEDLLDSSKMKAGTLRVDRTEICVADILDSVNRLVESKARAKQVDIESIVSPEVPSVFGDHEKIVRILVNLATNAIKFSPSGSCVAIQASCLPAGEVEFAVIDRGPGLTPEDQRAIFDRFKQLDNEPTRSVRGFGLGLNIARELAWLNLGTMHVESQPGAGSTFAIRLPTADPAVVIDHYFKRLDEATPVRPELAVLNVSCTEEAMDAEAIRGFLVSCCYPTDLVLPSAGGREVLIVGCTDSIPAWSARLAAAHESICPEGKTTASLRIACLGGWPYSEGRTAATSLVLERCAPESLHCLARS